MWKCQTMKEVNIREEYMLIDRREYSKKRVYKCSGLLTKGGRII